MDTNKLTSVFGFVFASTQMKAALEGIQTNGFSFETIWAALGAVAVSCWAYYTNKK